MARSKTDIDVDMYSFTAALGQTIDFDIDTTLNGPGGLGSFLRLFSSQGVQLASNNDATAPGESTLGFDAYLRYSFCAAGTFYIAVSNANNIGYNALNGGGDTPGGQNSIGAYTLIVQEVVVPADDPDDQISEAISLGAVSTTAITRSGSILPDVDVDMYSISVVTNQVVDLISTRRSMVPEV